MAVAESIATVLAQMPSGATKTAFQTDVTSLYNEIGTASTAYGFPTDVSEQLTEEFLDWCERFAANCADQ